MNNADSPKRSRQRVQFRTIFAASCALLLVFSPTALATCALDDQTTTARPGATQAGGAHADAQPADAELTPAENQAVEDQPVEGAAPAEAVEQSVEAPARMVKTSARARVGSDEPARIPGPVDGCDEEAYDLEFPDIELETDVPVEVTHVSAGSGQLPMTGLNSAWLLLFSGVFLFAYGVFIYLMTRSHSTQKS